MDFFPSLRALQDAHQALLQRSRETGKMTPELLAEVEQFLRKASETGRILDAVSDQVTAQGLLDYWTTVLYRENKEAPDTLLADFDASAARELADEECPYIGLRSFHKNEDRIFFGREKAVRDLLQLLRAGNFIAVVGAAASGRTSVVQAGLVAALARGQLAGSEKWPVYEASPPLDSQIGTASDLTSVLVIDDCDDIFLRGSEQEQHDFAAAVERLANSPGIRRIVVLVLRSGYEDRFARFPALEARIRQSQLRLGGPTAKEVRDAIERPADLVGLKFDDGVVDAIVDDLVGERAAFALLQFTMRRLWAKRANNRITTSALQEVGIGRAALVRAAQMFHAELGEEQKQLLRQLLVRLSAGPQPACVPWHALLATANDPDKAAKLIEAMAEIGLVSVSARANGDRIVKLAHDCLSEQWDTLADWLGEERQDLNRRRRLETKAGEWVRLGRPKKAALLGEPEIQEAEQWLNSEAAVRMGVSDDARALVATSKWRLRRDIQRLRAEAAVFALLALIGVIAAGIATYEWIRADQAKDNEHVARVDEHLQSELTGLALIEGELLKTRRDAGAAQAYSSQLRISAATASSDRNRPLLEEAEKLETALRTRIEQLGRARAKAISSIAAENEKRWQEMDTSKQEQIVADVLKAIAPAEEAGDDRAGAFNRESKLRIALFAVAAVPRDDARLDQALRATISRYGLRERYAPPGASQVWGVAFSPNKNVLQAAIGDDIGIVRLWKPLASDPARELSTGSGVVNGVAFSPDGSLFAAANRSFGAVVWKLDEDNPRCKLTGNGGAFSVAFAPGNKLLAVASSDRTVRLWELPQEAGAKCRQVGEPLPHSDQVFGVAFSPDGRLLATASGDGMVSVWSLDEATIGPASKPFRQFPDNPKRPGEPMFAVQFSSTGKQLLVASAADGQGYIWDIETGQQTELPTQKGTLGQTAFSPNGEFVVATASDAGAAIVSDPSTGETVARFGGNPLAPPMRRKLFGVAFSPDSKYLLTGNLDGVARLWAMGANEVPAVGRDELIRLGRQLIGDSEMALSPGPECEALRKLGVPIFTFADKPWDETSKAILCPLPFLEPQAKAN